MTLWVVRLLDKETSGMTSIKSRKICPTDIDLRLMVQKSGDHHLECIKPVVNNGISTTNLNWLAGFLNHQQYFQIQHLKDSNKTSPKIRYAFMCFDEKTKNTFLVKGPYVAVGICFFLQLWGYFALHLEEMKFGTLGVANLGEQRIDMKILQILYFLKNVVKKGKVQKVRKFDPKNK